ncbi:sensor histidine kinase [Rhizobium glycinendophyticum]|uniref:histidine kinase n=1 Tax=Rhizobium glycinendophyticum TaxID=2589807 RepID=A0A504U604_9HYPH|nr:HAMP domain-containing sensor histidine kinase [Rhizobium glycinendophyticum]TPP10454.1 HAMP domain-containing histidine kinase [Rhizobium glycinendophyticum]
MSKRPSLFILAAALVSFTQIITIALLFLSVDWYIDHAELSAIESLPPDARSAWTSLNKGEVPETKALTALVALYPQLEEQTEGAPVVGVLGFGFALIVFTSVIGVVLAYRIVAPLTRLTAAAEQIRQGDFRVEVEPGATKEVEALATTFNRLASELLQLETRLKFNSRAVAHELRTPLTVLQGNLQAMADGVLEVSEERVRALLLQAQSMSGVVDQLNTLSMAGTANFITATTSTDLALHVSDTLSLFQASAGSAIDCRMDLSPAPANIDPPRFRQALLALLENARRYAGDFGPIEVRTGVDEAGRSFISVTDHGPRLPSDVAHSSFDMFWRSEAPNGRDLGGSGLGLTVVKAIAEGHKARFQVGNRAEAGAYATILFEAQEEHGLTRSPQPIDGHSGSKPV